MPSWKQMLLGVYYGSTLGMRRVYNRRAKLAGNAPVIVLTYHRVADDAANAWTVSRAMFARHLHWLKMHFDLISLPEAQEKITTSANDRPAVSITFDDGYAENCEFALPLLIEQKIPCTYFVTSNNVLKGDFFPHDLAMGNQLPPNTPRQLRALSAAGVEIGTHSRTHANLGPITDRDRLQEEIVQARRELESELACRIRYFAFPFGQHANLNSESFRIAAEAGYDAVFSAYGGYNFSTDDTFHLHRICAEGSLMRLSNWCTFDPFRHWLVKRFVCQQDVPVGREFLSERTPIVEEVSVS